MLLLNFDQEFIYTRISANNIIVIIKFNYTQLLRNQEI